MPTIVQAMKSEAADIYLTTGERTLQWSTSEKEWIVYEEKPPSAILCQHKDQKTAVAFLLGKR